MKIILLDTVLTDLEKAKGLRATIKKFEGRYKYMYTYYSEFNFNRNLKQMILDSKQPKTKIKLTFGIHIDDYFS